VTAVIARCAEQAQRGVSARSGDIRTWREGHGIAVNDRGRIPASVVEQYDAAIQGT
jgi:hypothetical protein